MVVVRADVLTTTVRDIFVAAGCAPEEADRVADDLVGANLTGHDSHGVVRVPTYVEWMRSGFVRAGRTAETVTDGGSFVVLDGHRGFGQTIAAQAVATGIERARRYGLGVVAVRDSGHVGRVGRYAETAVDADLVSIHFVNVAGSSLVAPFGAVDRRFSTAPVAVGVPLPGHPIVLDFATSVVAEGKVQVAADGGVPVPGDALITSDGRRSGDPQVLYGSDAASRPRSATDGTGAIRAFGEHKGSGLALICELLAGALTGGGCAGPPDPARPGIANGMLSIYLSPSWFGTREEFERIGLDYVEWVRSARPVEEGRPVLVPGDEESRNRAERLVAGIPLPADTWDAVRRTAEDLGVTPSDEH